ncbi:hypothetical protein P9273_11200 [Mesorhizobium sp. WSM4935]|uniref:hypothetical protein n=1 Tax=Mesorhizobium sp. WSM4935 TaxID=3038547 RepID=UPI000595BD5A|nr:hypothetical protein [Mesorhizobium sp. WSM4935]MDG4875663.1 hypothetical protein [Mesorhizobium sp. WSM4935]
MKAFLTTIAVLGLSVSGASADCAYHQSMASATQVDTQKTASVQKSDVTKASDAQQIKKEAPPKTE